MSPDTDLDDAVVERAQLDPDQRGRAVAVGTFSTAKPPSLRVTRARVGTTVAPSIRLDSVVIVTVPLMYCVGCGGRPRT